MQYVFSGSGMHMLRGLSCAWRRCSIRPTRQHAYFPFMNPYQTRDIRPSTLDQRQPVLSRIRITTLQTRAEHPLGYSTGRASDCLTSHACVPGSHPADLAWGFQRNIIVSLNMTRRSRYCRPRRVKVETSVSTLISRRATRCALLHKYKQQWRQT